MKFGPIRYAGGKRKAVKIIKKYIPSNLKKLISPFFGGGALEFFLAQNNNIKIEGFDILEPLINYWQFQLSEPENLSNKISEFIPDKKFYYEIKKEMDIAFKKNEYKNNIEFAAKFFFNFQYSYGPAFPGWASNVYLNEKSHQKQIEKVKNFKCDNVNVSLSHFVDVLKNNENEFLYLDPPYYLDGDSTLFRGLYPNRNNPIYHKNFNHEKLKELLFVHKGKFILSYNNCSTIKNWYKDFEQVFPEWKYTFQQGETRIGKNRKNKKETTNKKKSSEILIMKL